MIEIKPLKSIIKKKPLKVRTSKETASKTEDGLNPKQELFCQLYINADRELFGNGTKCYFEIYGPDYLATQKKIMPYNTAMVLASQLLRNIKVIDRINSLLETGGFTDENVDKQHLFLINQHADLKTKLGAIKEYNALKKRVDNKLNVSIEVAMDKYLEERNKQIKSNETDNK